VELSTSPIRLHGVVLS